MQVRRPVPREDREQQMLDVAARLFAERGFSTVSMDEIAERVGVTKPMLYLYFGSKEGLFVSCIVRLGEPLAERLERAVDSTEPPERQLWAGLRAFFAFVAEERERWTALLLQMPAYSTDVYEQLAGERERIHASVSALLVRAAADVGVTPDLSEEIEIQAHALMGAAESLAVWSVRHPDVHPDVLALRLMNFAWRGFEALLQGRLWLPESGDAPSTP
jgi:AcrR family transcriptional regulator